MGVLISSGLGLLTSCWGMVILDAELKSTNSIHMCVFILRVCQAQVKSRGDLQLNEGHCLLLSPDAWGNAWKRCRKGSLMKGNGGEQHKHYISNCAIRKKTWYLSYFSFHPTELYNSVPPTCLPIVYHPDYNITFMGLEKLHPFDAGKWGKVIHFLKGKHVRNRGYV